MGESCGSRDRETKHTAAWKRKKKGKGNSLEKEGSRVGSLSVPATMAHTNLPTNKAAHIHVEFLVESGQFQNFSISTRSTSLLRNFTSERSSSCFPTNRSNRSSAARTRDNTATKEATISKKRTMTRRMKKRPQENRRCYGFAKAFLSERFSTPTRSVAVTSSGQILNEAARSRLTNNFGTSTASGHRSAFYLLISRLQKRLRTH